MVECLKGLVRITETNARDWYVLKYNKHGCVEKAFQLFYIGKSLAFCLTALECKHNYH